MCIYFYAVTKGDEGSYICQAAREIYLMISSNSQDIIDEYLSFHE